MFVRWQRVFLGALTSLEQERPFSPRGFDQGKYSPQLPVMLAILLGTGTDEEDASEFILVLSAIELPGNQEQTALSESE